MKSAQAHRDLTRALLAHGCVVAVDTIHECDGRVTEIVIRPDRGRVPPAVLEKIASRGFGLRPFNPQGPEHYVLEAV